MYASKFTEESIGPGLSKFLKNIDESNHMTPNPGKVTCDSQTGLPRASNGNVYKNKRKSIAAFFQQGNDPNNDRSNGNSASTATTNESNPKKKPNSGKNGLKGFFAKRQGSQQIDVPCNANHSTLEAETSNSPRLSCDISPTDACNSLSEIKNFNEGAEHATESIYMGKGGVFSEGNVCHSLMQNNSRFDCENECVPTQKEVISNSKEKKSSHCERSQFQDGNTCNSENGKEQQFYNMAPLALCNSVSHDKTSYSNFVVSNSSQNNDILQPILASPDLNMTKVHTCIQSDDSNNSKPVEMEDHGIYTTTDGRVGNDSELQIEFLCDPVSPNQRFLEPNTTCTTVELVQCEKCSEMVSPWMMPEHLDFHFASELEVSMNNTLPVGGTIIGNNPRKKRKLSNNLSKKQGKKKQNERATSLDFFFSRKDS